MLRLPKLHTASGSFHYLVALLACGLLQQCGTAQAALLISCYDDPSAGTSGFKRTGYTYELTGTMKPGNTACYAVPVSGFAMINGSKVALSGKPRSARIDSCLAGIPFLFLKKHFLADAPCCSGVG